MPGGRSRSNSIEVSSPNAKMQAWIMTDENTSEYNPTFLKNAEKVKSPAISKISQHTNFDLLGPGIME